MKSERNVVVEGSNLTEVWLGTAERLLRPGVVQLTHFEARIVGFAGNRPDESPAARGVLDSALRDDGPCDTNATANLIFPEKSWVMARHAKRSVGEFFARYHASIAPRLAKQDARNRQGTYFDRMIAYPTPRGPLNQLDKLLDNWAKGRHRQSAYQVQIYQPALDLDGSPYMGFPCLDHVAFTRDGNQLVVSAFYASQLVFDRAFGNHLGLCRLGAFMAEQMHLEFAQLSCHVGAAKLSDDTGKTAVRTLVTKMREAAQSDATRKAA